MYNKKQLLKTFSVDVIKNTTFTINTLKAYLLYVYDLE